MKRVFSLALCVLMVFGILAGCGSNNQPTTNKPTTGATVPPTVTNPTTTVPPTTEPSAPEGFVCLNEMIEDSDIKITIGGSAILLDELQQECVHWQVALACNLLHNGAICQIVQIVVILADIKEAIGLKSPRLMYLKIQANCFHIFCIYLFR